MDPRMDSTYRSTFAVVLIGTALVAAAITPAHSAGGGSADFMGSWITWTPSEDGGIPICRRLYVTDADGTARSGGWDAPGWNGLVSGSVAPGASGRTELHGEWRDGRIAGAFALTLHGENALHGTFSAPGGDAPQRWEGRRDTGRPEQGVPCRFER